MIDIAISFLVQAFWPDTLHDGVAPNDKVQARIEDAYGPRRMSESETIGNHTIIFKRENTHD